jgi:O-antigen ligase
MTLQTLYWLLLMVGIFATMFVIVPAKARRELWQLGIWLGLVQAFFWLWLFQANFQLFRLVGDPTLFGIPVIASLSWIPAVILFGYYFFKMDTTVKTILLILLFAVGGVAVQYFLEMVGLWQNLNWNLVYTFILALTAHIIISTYLLITRHRLKT